MDTKQPRISIVIPTCRQSYLADTLKGLTRQSPKIAFEVIVVENGGRDPETFRLAKVFAGSFNIRHVVSDTPGLNRARNLGVRLARGPVIALLDDDTIPHPTWLSAVYESHRGYPEAAVIGGRTVLKLHAETPSWLVGELRHVLSEVDWSAYPRPLQKNEWIVGANMSFKLSTFEKIGGFAVDLGMCGRDAPQLCNDDTEFCNRAVERVRAEIVFDPRIKVDHQIPSSRLRAAYFLQRFSGQGISRAATAIMAVPIEERGPTLSEVVRQHLYCSAWVRKTLEYAGSVPDSERQTYLALSIHCRLACLCGLGGVLKSSLKQNHESIARIEYRYQQRGRRSMSHAMMRGPSGLEAYEFVFAVLKSLKNRGGKRSQSSKRMDTVLGRIAFLKGMLDMCPTIPNEPLEATVRNDGKPAEIPDGHPCPTTQHLAHRSSQTVRPGT